MRESRVFNLFYLLFFDKEVIHTYDTCFAIILKVKIKLNILLRL